MEMNLPRVMIVDDVEANRFILKNIIETMECQPILAENGIQALKIVQKLMPSLILLDVAMPEMDGYEFCKIMKGNPATRNIPIIFISAYDEPKDIVRGFELGSEDYITKPFIPEVVKARVGVHLKLHHATKDLLDMNRKLTASVTEQLRQIEQEKKNVLYAIANVARENSSYEEAHMERLGHNCSILAQAMQLSASYEHLISDSYVETIRVASPLCDTGNLVVPRDILQKNSALTPEEVEIMRTHTTAGAKMFRDINAGGDYNDFMVMCIDIAQSHHENWDGSGYPEGLKGDNIPISAQIVSIMSAYCALTEIRTYRDPFSKEQALEILEQDAGKKFNPEICAICKKISRQLQ